jgi:hypothetical protein
MTDFSALDRACAWADAATRAAVRALTPLAPGQPGYRLAVQRSSRLTDAAYRRVSAEVWRAGGPGPRDSLAHLRDRARAQRRAQRER